MQTLSTLRIWSSDSPPKGNIIYKDFKILVYGLLLWTHQNSYKGNSGEARSWKPSQSGKPVNWTLDLTWLPMNIINKLLTLNFSQYWLIVPNYGAYEKCGLQKKQFKKMYIHFCKMCLGVNKPSTNVASRNEIGILFLRLHISASILKFRIHCENQPPDSIAKLC